MSEAVEGVALLPCPFCGNSMEDRGYGVMHTDGARGARCILSGYSFPFVEAWNTRTTPPARSYADAIEDAAKACEDQQQVFLSPQYATGQPLSSFHERFACGQCAAAIRLLSQGGKA